MKIFVTGGAGYIGLQVAKILQQQGHEPWLFDNFSTGNRDLARNQRLIEGDLLAVEALEKAFQQQPFDAVMHFAALASVPESVAKPHLYYEQNVVGSLNLLRTMQRFAVQRIIFSSTAAVYGEPREDLIDETHPTQPINPYGHSKRIIENILEELGNLQGLRHMTFRYFNAAGADPDNGIGEKHDPEHHLIPLVMKAAVKAKRENTACTMNVFGQTFATPDGSCIRDFVHVRDIAQAHVLGLTHLERDLKHRIFNVGSEKGFSVLEVLAQASQTTGVAIKPNILAPRAGDPARLVACSQRLRQTLNWRPEHSALPEILKSAWDWENVLNAQNPDRSIRHSQ